MANSKSSDKKYLYDYLRSVQGGHVAGIDPLLINRQQLAFFRNGTVRGTFPTHRPAYVNVPLSFGDGSFQGAFEQGLFQGAGYYKPDFGLEQIIVQVGGRIFAITINGSTGALSEITIVGDSNSTTLPQAWMWQAEKWMIINDGQNLPVFYDGNSSRRSLGGTVTQVATVNTTASAPAAGSTVPITLNSTFSGPFNTPLRFQDPGGGASGTMIAVGTGAFSGYGVTLKNTDTTNTVGASVAVGTEVDAQTTFVGQVATQHNLNPFLLLVSITLDLQAPPAFGVGTQITVPVVSTTDPGTSFTATITGVSGNNITCSCRYAARGHDLIAAGAYINTTTNQNVLVGFVQTAFTIPAFNASVTCFLDRIYAGAIPQNVTISGKKWQITGIPSIPPSTTVTFLNVNFPSGTNNIIGNATPASACSISTLAELPAGRMGTYGLGRVWMALTDGRSFIGGDIVGGSSGTTAYQKRDAVLRVAENQTLQSGSFVVPGQVGDIRAMIFASTLDTSLGQGPLVVVTPNVVFSCQAPVDFNLWQQVTNPILTESMKGGGGLGQNSTTTLNSDILMRATVGIRSYIQGRRDFDVWGNVPISREVEPTLATDDPNLLQFTSAVEFDNRWLLTTNPTQSNFGTYWSNLVALNADAISSLSGKAPSVYDGIWDGLNILQILKGSFNGVERCFAICVSSDLTKIELWEVLKSSDMIVNDNNVTPITWEYQSAALNFYENDPRKRDFFRLIDGEIRIDKLDQTLFEQFLDEPHTVTIQSFYRSEQSIDFEPWHTDTINFDPNTTDSGYRYAIGFGEPSGREFDPINNMPLRHGSVFQFKFVITGHCRVVLHRFKAVNVPELDFAAPKDDNP